MPTYEYVCENCGHNFEHFQSITARPLRKCPQCGRRTLQRLIGVGGGVLFKGSGFYQTDYRSESYKKAAEAEKAAQSGAKKDGGDSKTADGKQGRSSENAAAAKSTSKAAGERKAG